MLGDSNLKQNKLKIRHYLFFTATLIQPFDRFERFLIYLNLNEVIFVAYLYLYLAMKISMQMQHQHLQATKLTCLGLVTAFLQVLNQ